MPGRASVRTASTSSAPQRSSALRRTAGHAASGSAHHYHVIFHSQGPASSGTSAETREHAGLDMRTGQVFASTPLTTGIKPFMDLAGQVMACPGYKDALQLPPVDEISRAGGGAGHGCRTRRLTHDLLTGQAPVPARSTAKVDPETSQNHGSCKDSQHSRDHERSPLKERPDAYVRGSPSGLLDLRRQVSRHFGTGHTGPCLLSLRPGTRL